MTIAALKQSIAFLVALTTCARMPGVQDLSLAGTWRVTAVHCRDCSHRKFSGEGAKLLISSERISNPLADNCDSDVAFSGIKPAKAASLLAGPGKHWPSEIRRSLARNPALYYGFVTCQGLNYMRLLVLSPRQMLYFYEGGEVFTLYRAE